MQIISGWFLPAASFLPALQHPNNRPVEQSGFCRTPAPVINFHLFSCSSPLNPIPSTPFPISTFHLPVGRKWWKFSVPSFFSFMVCFLYFFLFTSGDDGFEPLFVPHLCPWVWWGMTTIHQMLWEDCWILILLKWLVVCFGCFFSEAKRVDDWVWLKNQKSCEKLYQVWNNLK